MNDNKLRKGRDSNPRYQFPDITVFETAPFNRSGTFPIITIVKLNKNTHFLNRFVGIRLYPIFVRFFSVILLTERCRSGLTGTPGKRVYLHGYREFESLSLRTCNRICNHYGKYILFLPDQGRE